MISTTYLGGRELIQNGDIVCIYRPHKFSAKFWLYAAINFFTGSPIYHTVVALWMTAPSGEKKLMCVESNLAGGKRIVPLSIYQEHRLEVIAFPNELRFIDMEPALLARVAQQPYGLADFIPIAMKEFFGLKNAKSFDEHNTKQVCSELCADAWIQAGFPLSSTLISPGKLKSELLRLGAVQTVEMNAPL